MNLHEREAALMVEARWLAVVRLTTFVLLATLMMGVLLAIVELNAGTGLTWHLAFDLALWAGAQSWLLHCAHACRGVFGLLERWSEALAEKRYELDQDNGAR